jgi:glycosyltransferase involved in cell wall biosynthesis
MIINILIATIDSGIGKVEKILLEPRADLKYIVSHQVTAKEYLLIPSALQRADVRVGQSEGRGLSRNRNRALDMADGDIALLADDDVRYREGYIQALRETFEQNRDIDVACFRIATPGSEVDYKDYAKESYSLNEESHHYISSLEIAFRIEAVKGKKIRFDQRFGLGSELIQSGEEAVFIHDCVKSGLQVRYFPEYIVEHKAASTTNVMNKYAPGRNIFKGAYDARRFGWKALPAAFIDTFKLRSDLAGQNIKPARYLKERLQGISYILRS